MPRPRLSPALLPPVLCAALPLVDLGWNLTHLNLGLSDFYGLALAARALALHGAWPQSPYFPALYPALLVPFGLSGSVLAGGYVLSAAGLMLALFALRRLVSVLFKGAAEQRQPRPAEAPERTLLSSAPAGDGAVAAATLAILLAWLMPVWRVVAGSPSVDALYTGLGLWFITAAVAAWKATSPVPTGPVPSAPLRGAAGGDNAAGGDRPGPPGAVPPFPRLRLGPLPIVIVLWGTAFLLPLLRYHAAVLVVPVALLLFMRVRGRWAAAAVLKSAVAALALNFTGFVLVNGHTPADVAQLQIRTGLEVEQHLHFASAQELWDNYADLCARARGVPLLADYSAGQLAQHVLRDLAMFLRQPAIALALLLVALLAAAALRRTPARPRLLPGEAVLALWLVLYCLALSLAYYTARAALLPALAGLALTLALAARGGLRGLGAATALLLAGYGLAGRFAWQDFQERRFYAAACPALDTARLAAGAQIDATLAGDTRLVALYANPWCLPYIAAHGSWLDDPAIPPELTAGWQRVTPAMSPTLRLAALDTLHPDPATVDALERSGQWAAPADTPRLRIYRRR